MKKITWTVLLLGPSLTARAQDVIEASVEDPLSLIHGPNFWIALVVGVILAVAFQMMLTNFSLAVGISAAGPVDEGSGDERGRRSGLAAPGHVARRISSRFGVWALGTASVALFFACWLAVELSRTLSPTAGAVLALTIWGVFYIAMTAFEMSALSSLVGSLLHTAKRGLQSVRDASASVVAATASAVAGPDEPRGGGRPESPTDQVVDRVRRLLRQEFDIDDVRSDVQQFVDQLAPERTDPDDIRAQIEERLDDAELHAVASDERPILDRDEILASLEAEMPGPQAERMASRVQDAIRRIREDRSASDAGASAPEAEDYRGPIEDHLRRTPKEALDPEGIRRDVEQLFRDPQTGREALRRRARGIDRSTVRALLARRGDLSNERAARIADGVDQVLAKFRGPTGGPEDGPSEGDGRDDAGPDQARRSAEEKIRRYLRSLHRQEPGYEGVKQDVNLLFRDPRAGLDALLERFRAMDRDAFRGVVASQPGLTEADAERVLDEYEARRDETIARLEKMAGKARELVRRAEAGLDHAGQEALHGAEEARKTAAAAAWWSFATALVSAGAAVLGGVVAVAT